MGTITRTVEGNIASFVSAGKADIRSLKCYFTPTQSGTGDASPTNIRPIVGWQGLSTICCAVNLFNKDEDYSANNFYYKSDGTTVVDNNYRTTGYIKIKPSTTYFWAINGTDGVIRPGHSAPRVTFFDKNKIWLSSSDKLSQGNSMTSPSTAVYARLPVYIKEPDGVKSAMFIEGNTAPTSYEPYRGQTIPITFPNNNTVYGGYVDLITGDIVAEYEYMTDTWGNWGTVSDQGDGTELRYKRFTNPVLGNTAGTNEAYCNVAPGQYANNNGATHFYIVSNSYNCRIFLPSGTDTNLQIQAVGKLVTPIVVTTLTPLELQTLVGRNNIWSNANSKTSVTYDIHETSQIIEAKKKIIRNEPHLALASGNIATFNTDMVAPIKSAKFYFEPTQNGTPTPSNPIAINGWTDLEIYQTGKTLLDPTIAGSTQGQPNGIQTNITVNSNGTVTVGARDGTSWTARGKLNLPVGTYRLYSEFGSGFYSRYIIGDVVNEENFAGYKNLTLTEPCYLRFKAAMGTGYPVTGYLQVLPQGETYDTNPYHGITTNVTWESEGTIYGGYLDLISGQLVATYQYYTFTDGFYSYEANAQYNGTLGTNRIHNLNYGRGNVYLSDKLAYSKTGTWSTPNNYIWKFCLNASYQLHVVFDNATIGITEDMNYSTRSTMINNWCAENPLSFAIPLQSPQVITTLTPTQLLTFRGTNNIWSNANGAVDIQYWKH